MRVAGRELDTAVSKALDNRWKVAIGYDEKGEPILDIPPFSISEEWAWAVVRTLWEKGYSLQMFDIDQEDCSGYVVGFAQVPTELDEMQGHYSHTMPMAVCVAALETLEEADD